MMWITKLQSINFARYFINENFFFLTAEEKNGFFLLSFYDLSYYVRKIMKTFLIKSLSIWW